MNKNITSTGKTPDSSAALSVSLVIGNGDYAVAKDLFAQNPNKEVFVTTPDGNFSIIPLGNDKTLLVPSTGSPVFDTWVSIRETQDEFIFGPFDIYAAETKNSFSERYKNLISNSLVSPQANLNNAQEIREYDIEKATIEKLLKKDGSMQFEELMTAITELLENHPTVVKHGKTRNITAYDVVKVLKTLLQHGIPLETACYELNSWGNEFNEIILAKDKYSFFVKVAEYEMDEDYDD